MTLRVGVELELLAPPRRSRRGLADEIAARIGGVVTMSWHQDGDRTIHPDFGRYRHLTPAFDIKDGDGAHLVRIADDATINTDLDRKAPPARYWRRVQAGERAWLDRVRPHLAPLADPEDGVAKAAAANGLRVEQRGRSFRLFDDTGELVVIVTGVPGERPRVAECISPPLTGGVEAWFDVVAGAAAELGFGLPVEGATHFHLDAEPFRNGPAFRRLVHTFAGDLGPLRERFGTNMNCRVIGVLDPALVAVVDDPAYDNWSWATIQDRCQDTGVLTKYCDVNLQHLLAKRPRIDTVEFRMLPATLDPGVFADLWSGVQDLAETITGD